MPASGVLPYCLHQFATATMHTVGVICATVEQELLKAFSVAAFLQPFRHTSVSIVFKSSQSSRGLWTMPSPHTSLRQVALHPSLSTLFPSSHCSVPVFFESP